MADTRSVTGDNKRLQGADEEITWTLDVTNVGGSGALSDLDMTVTDETTDTDVTATVTTGAMSSTGQVITLKKIQDLTEAHNYRVDVLFDKDGDRPSVRFWLVCE
jgi:hypothetical protein